MKNRNRLLKGFLVFYCFFSLPGLFVQGQTSNISGVVNSYYNVVEIIPAKACIRVGSTAGLAVNKKILLVQMKGATINTSNSSSFGTVTALNEAGNYEAGTICSITGDSVFLFHLLQNTYTPATGKVQLVPFAEYVSATITDTVKASPWNNSTGTGGVIALYAEQDITLNAPIYADAAGFRGGSYLLSNGTCSDVLPASGYIYNASSASPQNGAAKGESITDLTAAQSGGRGAPANGGGGGNNHNNSGGGGANLDAGGTGGGNSSNGVACTVTLRGEAGKSLSSNSGQKIYSGGGGGAGHSNNGLSNVSGANGGGIIFTWANNLIGNSQLITAGGGNGGSSLSDGAGGGGGGGTIILHVSSYTGPVTVQAKGGNGGNSNDGGNIGRCFGGGGGGGGGVIYFTSAIPAVTTTVSGGTAGVESGRDVSCNPAPQAAANGNNGQVIANYTFTRSSSPAGYCSLLLAADFISFTAAVVNDLAVLNWEVADPSRIRSFFVEKRNASGNWETIRALPGAGPLYRYSFTDPAGGTGYRYYRIRILGKDNTMVFSAIKSIYLKSPADFIFFPNPASNEVHIIRRSPLAAEMRLTDLAGRIILQKQIYAKEINLALSPLVAGVYLLSINGLVKKLEIR
ncbi:MAG: T9SS type A sorting domain-containing protein [Sphingobacteriales bacterium]|nr:T9SS type A sorting domain-containing protein [Sphingobacteriales bacterium]